MELSKCLGCMEDLQGYPCPNCGYDPVKEKRPEYALPPESILAGKYLVGKVLGQGGFGITYIGWDLALERKVAIKEYYPSGQVSRSPGTRSLTWYTNEPAIQAREDGMGMFLKEARKMVKADSIPGVVRVLDLFQENGTAYIVMDFVSGETLKTRLQKTGPMAWTQAAPIFRPAIRAMEQVHQAGLIHRDLSPDNLMLTPNGDVKILDLGAAKDLNLNSGASSMQVAKSGFSPLEQYTQRGGSGPWTDVYSMAATIYYTLTGKLPPNAIDRMEEDAIDWSDPGMDSLPKAALKALQAAMSVSVKKRTQSMEELEEGLFEKAEPTPRPKPIPKATPEEKAAPNPKPEKETRKKGWKAAVVAAIVLCGTLAWGIGFKKSDGMSLDDVLNSAFAAKGMQSVSIAAGDGHTVGLRNDGTLVATGNNKDDACNVSYWKNVVSIAAGDFHTVGLRSDGSVVAVGYDAFGQCDTGTWKDIVGIAAGSYHTVGLRRDGSVVAVGDNEFGQCNVSTWKNIIAVAAGEGHTVGLCSDGTAVATGDNKYGQCNVSDWKDIVAITAGVSHTVGLQSNNVTVAVGYTAYNQCEPLDSVTAIAAGRYHTVGLRKNGTVVANGWNWYGQCDVENWKNIVAIAAGPYHTVGLQKNGNVLAVGNNDSGQCDVSYWKNIRIP